MFLVELIPYAYHAVVVLLIVFCGRGEIDILDLGVYIH